MTKKQKRKMIQHKKPRKELSIQVNIYRGRTLLYSMCHDPFNILVSGATWLSSYDEPLYDKSGKKLYAYQLSTHWN